MDSDNAAIGPATDAVRPATAIRPADSLAGLGVDRVGGRDSVREAAPRGVVAPSRAPADTAPIEATPAELDQLRAVLAIPVEGVRAADLRDSYTESRGGHVHQAIDIPAPRGTPVLSATDGRLLKRFHSVPGGLMVYAADATDRFILMYGHLDRYADGLSEGMPLHRGQVLGYVGTTGDAAPDAPHLHFALARGRPATAWWRGTPVNPYPLLAR